MFPEYHCAVCKVCLLNVESLMVVYRDTMWRLGCVENMAAPYWGIVLALLITRARINIRVSQYKYDSADQIWASSFIHLHTRTVTHSPSPGNCPYMTAAAIYWTTSSVKVSTVCTLHIISTLENKAEKFLLENDNVGCKFIMRSQLILLLLSHDESGDPLKRL